MDGKVAHLSVKRFQEIFEGCHLKLSRSKVEKIIAAIKSTGFIQKGVLHSWDKFNRHAVEYEERMAMKRRAAFGRWKEKVEPSHDNGEAPEPEHPRSAERKLKPTQELYAINQQLEIAQGDEKKKLLKRKRELLRATTGVDKDKPQPRQRATLNELVGFPKESREEIERGNLVAARSTLKDLPDALTPSMVLALADAGELTPALKKKFASVLEHRGGARNPVPG
jgi:hypothetical protein